MENFKWLEKWYSKHVIEHINEKISFKIENNNKDHSWKIFIDFSKSDYKHLDEMIETNKVSDYNYFKINAIDKIFKAEGDFTKLNFLLGKFRAYIGETYFHSYDRDCFLNPDIQKFIFEYDGSAKIYLHYTSEKKVATDILKQGFEFLAFDKTTVPMINDTININYNHMLCKPFGKFAVVINIGNEVYKKYLNLISKYGKKDLKVEEVLLEKATCQIDFNENVYTLHHKFIKGFIDYTKGEIYKNPNFNMNFDDVSFEKFLK